MNCSLNYVWIQAVRKSFSGNDGMVTCPIPDRLMDNIIATAQAHAEIDILIWVDIYGVGNNSPAILKALSEEVCQPNITFKSLDEIAAYQRHPIFREDFDGYEDHRGGNNTVFWRQHDLARLYVVDHVMDTISSPVFYSDMDMNLLKETLPKSLQRIDQYGTVVGMPNPYCAVDCQFFGFDQKGREFLKVAIIPLAEDATNTRLLGWEGFRMAYEDFATSYLKNLKFSTLLNVCAYSIPDAEGIKQSYQGQGISVTTSSAQSAPLPP